MCKYYRIQVYKGFVSMGLIDGKLDCWGLHGAYMGSNWFNHANTDLTTVTKMLLTLAKDTWQPNMTGCASSLEQYQAGDQRYQESSSFWAITNSLWLLVWTPQYESMSIGMRIPNIWEKTCSKSPTRSVIICFGGFSPVSLYKTSSGANWTDQM